MSHWRHGTRIRTSTPSAPASPTAAALADDHTRHVAERLGSAIESSTRLALIQALSDAASTISAELAPSSVELRMAGSGPGVRGVGAEDRGRTAPCSILPERPGDRDRGRARATPTTSRWPGSPSAAPVGQGQGRRGGRSRRDLHQRLADPAPSWTRWPTARRRATGHSPPMPAHAAQPGVIVGPHGPFGRRRLRTARPVLGGRRCSAGDRPRPGTSRPHAADGRVQGWVR